jgi:hypothetical protein
LASFLYDEFRLQLADAATHSKIDLESDSIQVTFIDEADDTIDQTADVDFGDRASAARVPAFASSPLIANNSWAVTSNVGVFDGDDTVFTTLTGDQVESYDIYKDSGTDTTSPMISNHDDATGLPLTPSGGNVTIVWAATGIIRI